MPIDRENVVGKSGSRSSDKKSKEIKSDLSVEKSSIEQSVAVTVLASRAVDSIDSLEAKSVADLRSHAKKLGIAFSALKKYELAHAIHMIQRYHTGTVDTDCKEMLKYILLWALL